MKIGIAVEGKMVSGHFGHCEGFNVYEVENKKILNKEFVQNPGHKPGYLPRFLKELNIDLIIAGGMGGSAQQLFAENSIKVMVGVQGDSDKVIKDYLEGEVQAGTNTCKEK